MLSSHNRGYLVGIHSMYGHQWIGVILNDNFEEINNGINFDELNTDDWQIEIKMPNIMVSFHVWYAT